MARELRHLTATLILDAEDAYARARGTGGRHPRPIGSVDYDLVGRLAAGQRVRFAQPQRLILVRNPSGYDLFFGEARVGDTQRTEVTPGDYVVRAVSPTARYQPSEREATLPSPDTPVFFDLQPGHNYPFPTETLPGGRGPTLLRGAYLLPSGAGTAEVAVRVPNRTDTYVTDQTGQWVLVFPDDEPTGVVMVQFERPDGAVQEARDVVVVGGRTSSLPQTALRGAARTMTGVAIADATVAVSGQTAQVRSGLDGTWAFHFAPDQPAATVTVTATLPDGRSQANPNIQVQPRSTVHVPTFEL